MKTLFDKNTQEDQERELHNSMISARYNEMLNGVDKQFTEKAPELNATMTMTSTPVMDTPVNTPAMEQTPQVSEYTPSALVGDLFTTAMFDNVTAQPARDTFAPTVVMPKTVEKPTVKKAESYSLTPLAKIAMVAFTALVVTMLAFIGANTRTIQHKSLKLKNLEQKKQELMERNEEIQRYIEDLQTEESIIERATEAGLLN